MSMTSIHRRLSSAVGAITAVGLVLGLAGTAQAAPPDWKLHELPAVPGAHVMAIDGSADDDVWALRTADTTYIDHWDGTDWTTSNPLPETQLNDVVAMGRDEAWTVGSDGSGPVALRWNGDRWQPTDTSTVLAGGWFHAVAPVAEDDVWAVGTNSIYYDYAYLAHWDGTAWKQVDIPAPDGDFYIEDITVRAADDIWAVGHLGTYAEPFAIHWDGTTWTPHEPRDIPGRSLTAVTVYEGEIWAVAKDENRQVGLLRYDGRRWQTVVDGLGDPDTHLFGVAPDGRGGLLAVGWGTVEGGAILHYDGETASFVPSPQPDGSYVRNINHIESSGTTWIVGSYVGDGGATGYAANTV